MPSKRIAPSLDVNPPPAFAHGTDVRPAS